MTIEKIKKLICMSFSYKDGVFTPQIKPVLILGKPGLGKTALVYQLAEELEAKTGKPWPVIKQRLSELFPEDFAGLPAIDREAGVTRWYQPDFLPLKGVKEFEGTHGILLLDEINRAKRETLQAVMKVLDRDGILDTWLVIATGNLGMSDGTFVEQLDSAQERRFLTLQADWDVDTWLDWARGKGLYEPIVEFIEAKPNYGHYEYKNRDGMVRYVTPAHWEEMHRFIQINHPTDPLKVAQALAPAVLGPIAPEFLQFLRSDRVLSLKMLFAIEDPEVERAFRDTEAQALFSLNGAIVDHFARAKPPKNGSVKSLWRYVTGGYLSDDALVALLKQIQDVNPAVTEHLRKLDPDFMRRIESLWLKRILAPLDSGGGGGR